MKKTKALALILSAILAASVFTGCESKQTETPDDPGNTGTEEINDTSEEQPENVGGSVINPMKEAASLEALNEQAGVKLAKPGVMGVTDEAFYTINDLAQYNFTVAGVKYNFRAQKGAGEDVDISGVYTGEGTAFTGVSAEGIAYAEAESDQLARWFVDDVQYVLNAEKTLDADIFKGVAEELASLTGYVLPTDYSAFVGDYGDSVSMRAGATVTAADNGVTIVVHWASSAYSGTEWTINAVLDGEKLTYTDCTISTIEEEQTTDTQGEGGYFTISEGKLLWDGAAEESCRGCIFEKIVTE